MADPDFAIRAPPRRSRPDAPQPPTSAESSGGESSSKKGAPPQSRRTGVWGDTVFKPKEAAPATKLSPDTDDDIPVIPDLDELQEEELATQVAQAPNVAVNRVATYKELDSDLFQHAMFASVDDVSLRLLTTCLQTELEIKEPDEPWTWDTVFSEVMSQLPEQESPTHAPKETTNFA